jgi:hypothetical protein
MDESQRLEAAKRILADPMINEAWDLLAKEILISWEHSADHDVETRERLWLSLKTLGRFKSHFDSIVTTGKMTDKI